MKLEYLKKMDKVIRGAGTRNPDDVLSYMGFIYMDPGTSLPGFIMKQKQIVYYGVNKNLPEKKYAFASFHEAFHGICGHLSLADFTKQGAHADTFENHRVLAWTEREANIGAADTLIETELFLEMSGYDSEDVKAYIRSVESFEKAVENYHNHYNIVLNNGSPEKRIRRMQDYQRKLARMYEELQEQADDIMNCGYCLSRPEMAAEFDVPEFVIDYKYEAMAVRKYHVPRVELPTFDKVFGGW